MKTFKNIIFAALVIFLSSYILTKIFIPDKTIDILGFNSYLVVSSSMEPDIMVNDLVIIRKVKEEDLKVRDAITFSVYLPELGAKSKVTHYIGDIQNNGGTIIYKTQGATKAVGDYDNWKDANNQNVEITYSDIEGKVVLVVPYVGYVINILNNPVGLLLIALNIGIIYLLIKTIKKPQSEIENEDTKG